MRKKPDPYLIDDENPEWTKEDFERARPAREVMPKSFFKGMADLKRKRGRPSLKNPKKHIGFRLDSDIVDWLQAHKGYNSLVNKTLRDYIETH